MFRKPWPITGDHRRTPPWVVTLALLAGGIWAVMWLMPLGMDTTSIRPAPGEGEPYEKPYYWSLVSLLLGLHLEPAVVWAGLSTTLLLVLGVIATGRRYHVTRCRHCNPESASSGRA